MLYLFMSLLGLLGSPCIEGAALSEEKKMFFSVCLVMRKWDRGCCLFGVAATRPKVLVLVRLLSVEVQIYSSLLQVHQGI